MPGCCTTLSDLSDRALHGSLPEQLGQLTHLRLLLLSNNELTGDIPDSLTQLTALRTLWLHNTSFTGALPLALQQLPALQSLQVSRWISPVPHSLRRSSGHVLRRIRNGRNQAG
jgi:Leucine-rich repeat (LRR) protein